MTEPQVPDHDHVEFHAADIARQHLAQVHGRPVEQVPDEALGHLHFRLHRWGINVFPPSEGGG